MNKSVTPAPPKPRQNGRIHELSEERLIHSITAANCERTPGIILTEMELNRNLT